MKLSKTVRFFACVATVFVLSANAFAAKTKIVIVSATYGAGHNSAAESIKNSVLQAKPETEITILKLENYVRGGFGQLTSRAFDWIYQSAPGAYEPIWQATVATADNKTSAGDIPQPIFNKEQFYQELVAENPDIIVTTHHISAHLLINLRESGKISWKIPLAWLDTDWVTGENFFDLISKGVDMTFIAHPELYSERMRLGIPPEKMLVTGPPLNAAVFNSFSEDDRTDFLLKFLQTVDDPRYPKQTTFVNGITRPQGTHDIRLDPNTLTLTITSGRAGIGNYSKIFEGLVQEAHERGIKIQVIAVCAANEKNYKDLTAYYNAENAKGNMKGVTLVVTQLMEHSKMVKTVHSSVASIGKSGVQTPFEAIMMGVVSVSGKYIGGQERVAAEAYERLKLALTFEKSEEKLVGKKLFALLNDPVRMAEMRQAHEVAKASYRMDILQKYFKDQIERITSQGRVPLVPVTIETPAESFLQLIYRKCNILSRKRRS